MDETEGGVVEELSQARCWEVLRSEQVGRLAVVLDGRPDIFPVNHEVDHGTVVFRTAAGSKLGASLQQQVAFEVDGRDPVAGTAWSVVVHGWAREVRRLHEAVEAMSRPAAAWQGGSKPHLVVIEPEQVSGRQFTVRPSAERSTDAPAPG